MDLQKRRELSKKSAEELRKMRDGALKLLANKQIVDSLPDSGEKLRRNLTVYEEFLQRYGDKDSATSVKQPSKEEIIEKMSAKSLRQNAAYWRTQGDYGVPQRETFGGSVAIADDISGLINQLDSVDLKSSADDRECRRRLDRPNPSREGSLSLLPKSPVNQSGQSKDEYLKSVIKKVKASAEAKEKSSRSRIQLLSMNEVAEAHRRHKEACEDAERRLKELNSTIADQENTKKFRILSEKEQNLRIRAEQFLRYRGGDDSTEEESDESDDTISEEDEEERQSDQEDDSVQNVALEDEEPRSNLKHEND